MSAPHPCSQLQPVTVPSAPTCDDTEVGQVPAVVPGLPKWAVMFSVSLRLREGIHGHCCEGQPGAREVLDLLHQVSELVVGWCPDTAVPWEQDMVLSLTAYRGSTSPPMATHCRQLLAVEPAVRWFQSKPKQGRRRE